MDPRPELDPGDAAELIALFRKTIHQANNELMSIVQECELALLKEDSAAHRQALESAIDQAMAISRLHQETRQRILERTRSSEIGEDGHGHLDRRGGGGQSG
jgi:hypothetical protein